MSENNVKKQRLQSAESAELYDVNGNLIAQGNIHMNFNAGKQPNKYFKKGNFFLMSRIFAKMMKSKKDYNNLTFRLLFELLERIDFNNRIQTFRQSDLAEALEADQANISRALKKLLSDDIVVKKEHDYYFTDEFIKYASDLKK